jgi:hypothetical protein
LGWYRALVVLADKYQITQILTVDQRDWWASFRQPILPCIMMTKRLKH